MKAPIIKPYIPYRTTVIIANPIASAKGLQSPIKPNKQHLQEGYYRNPADYPPPSLSFSEGASGSSVGVRSGADSDLGAGTGLFQLRDYKPSVFFSLEIIA